MGMPDEASPPQPTDGTVRFGLVADPHVADLPPMYGRNYREASARLARRAAELRRDGASFLVELGDLKDAGPDEAATLANLDEACRALRAFGGPVHPVLGNHDVDRISKRAFLDGFARGMGLADPPSPFGAFDDGGVRFVRLDCDFYEDGRELVRGDAEWRHCSVPADQLDWLRATLASTPGWCVVFSHAPIADVRGGLGLRNAADVHKVLSGAGNVLAVFQGHTHVTAFEDIDGIPHFTLPALCLGEGPDAGAAALVTILTDGRVEVDGRGGLPSAVIPARRRHP